MKALLTIFFAFLFISMAAQSSWAKSGGYLPKNLFIKLAKKLIPLSLASSLQAIVGLTKNNFNKTLFLIFSRSS